MKHRYLPMTVQDQKEMLEVIGVSSVEELFSDIPEKVRFQGDYQIKPAKSESALLKELTKLAQKMRMQKQMFLFLELVFMIIIHLLL
ncbi:glycine dehydrogenase subunit 1 [Niallia nealsonii AAU1]|nr:glycine dehydrogenase subunit 1 [Niallia nealsonii AAU1]